VDDTHVLAAEVSITTHSIPYLLMDVRVVTGKKNVERMTMKKP
jgi:hypothetical protein